MALIGNGPLEQKIKQLVINKHLQDKVIFLGIRDDVAELYQAFDLFILPSLFEGLGIVAVEAQAAGLPCLLSDTLPSEAFICNYKKLSLAKPMDWVKSALMFANNFERKDAKQEIYNKGFSAEEVAKKIQDIYLNLENNK